MEKSKADVKDYWNQASCGEDLYLIGDTEKIAYINQSKKRYELEPYIIEFADFQTSKQKRVLEIGVGLGADHQCFAEAGADLFGIDITYRAVENTQRRFDIFNLRSSVSTGDAEKLVFDNDTFDIVYSWGVIHHSPNTSQAINEIYRVLRNNGKAKIMIYHKYSFVGYMLWIRYGLLKLKLVTSLESIYSKYLESPGTKAYSIKEGYQLFEQFKQVKIKVVLSHGDLLASEAGQRHRGKLLSIARLLWPRFLIKKLFPSHGLFMLIDATK